MAKQIIRTALNVLSALVLLGTVVFLIVYWRRIPDQVALHFDVRGEIDSWSAKGWLLMLPIVNAVISVTLFFAKTVRVRTLRRERRVPAPPLLFPLLNLPLTLGFSYITVCSALSRPLGVWFMPVFLGATLLPITVFSVFMLPKLT